MRKKIKTRRQRDVEQYVNCSLPFMFLAVVACPWYIAAIGILNYLNALRLGFKYIPGFKEGK